MTIKKILTVGHACLDIVNYVDFLPHQNCKVASKKLEIIIGGNAANAAVAITNLGFGADLCTVLGSHSHPFTRILMILLNEKKVGTKFIEFNEQEDCSVSSVFIDKSGSRTIVNFQSEKLQSLSSSDIDLKEYSIIMGDTYRMPMINQVFKVANNHKVPTMLDVDCPIHIDDLPQCDYTWFSAETFGEISKIYPNLTLGDIQRVTGGLVGVTDGANPVIWLEPESLTIKSYQPPKIEAYNTLGAGDVFRARFAIEICNQSSVSLAVKNACDTACEFLLQKFFYK